jgi:hypothetical protein
MLLRAFLITAEAAEPPMPQAWHDPWTYIAVVAVGLVVLFIRSLIKRLEYLEQALRTRDEQVDAALRVLPEVAEVLRKFHAAAQAETPHGERAP